jgi:hypothetical protein
MLMFPSLIVTLFLIFQFTTTESNKFTVKSNHIQHKNAHRSDVPDSYGLHEVRSKYLSFRNSMF